MLGMAKEDEAAALTETLDAKIEEARAAVAGKGDGLILLTNGGKISAYGANSRFGWLHGALDLPEAHPGLSDDTHGQAQSAAGPRPGRGGPRTPSTRRYSKAQVASLFIHTLPF